ncbi:MAG: hypothetical protein P1V81_16115 [Planctomycetota bacterium]|nr:hypothetical protein [Planctomycetota bacterium]
MTIKNIAIASAVGLSILTTITAAWPTTESASPSASVPDAAIWRHAIDDLRVSHGVWATPSITGRKTIRLKWHYNPGAEQVKKSVVARGEQSIEVQGQLTSIAAGEGGKLLVCTKQRNGDTRIEEYSVAAPLMVMTAEGPKLTPQAIQSKRTVYQANTPGKDIVEMSVRFRGQPDTYLVQFFDSKDMLLLHAGIDPVAFSPVVTSVEQPLIAEELDHCVAGEHKTGGYIYYFTSKGTSEFSIGTALYFVDSNKDGAFEHIGPLPTAAVTALELNPLENWVEHRGIPTVELLPEPE